MYHSGKLTLASTIDKASEFHWLNTTKEAPSFKYIWLGGLHPSVGMQFATHSLQNCSNRGREE